MNAPTATKYPWGENLWDHPDPFVLSFSSRGTLSHCKRKFEFYKTYKEAPGYESMEGEVGKALHVGYQEFLVTGDKDAALWAYARAYPIQLNAGIDDPRSLEAGIAVLDKLMNNVRLIEYKLATIKRLDGTMAPAIEVEFEIWIDGPLFNGRPIVYIGFIDAIFFNVITGEYIVVDLKTHRRWNLNVAGEYNFHGQCIPYGIVVQQAAGEDVMKFEIMYIPAYIDILEPVVQVYPIQKTAKDIQDWVTGLFFDIRDITSFAKMDFWPRTEHGCTAWNRVCEFLPICETRERSTIQLWLSTESNKVGKTRGQRKRDPWVRYVLPMPSTI